MLRYLAKRDQTTTFFFIGLRLHKAGHDWWSSQACPERSGWMQCLKLSQSKLDVCLGRWVNGIGPWHLSFSCLDLSYHSSLRAAWYSKTVPNRPSWLQCFRLSQSNFDMCLDGWPNGLRPWQFSSSYLGLSYHSTFYAAWYAQPAF